MTAGHDTRYFATTVGGLLAVFGTYSVGWLAVSAAGAVLSDSKVFFAAFAVGILAEFGLTNGPLKSVIGRSRPVDIVDWDRPEWVPIPVTSSFPSGHSSAAAFSAVALGGWSVSAGVLAGCVAAAIAVSRVVMRFHHTTDVLGGLLWGACLGILFTLATTWTGIA